MRGIAAKLFPALLAVAALAAGCGQKAEAPAPPAPTAAPAPAGRIERIAFVDQEEACECTMKRIQASWEALVAVVGDPPSTTVERVHLDTEAAKTEKYTEMEALIVPPGIYFLDGDEALVTLLQGEVTAAQIEAVLAR